MEPVLREACDTCHRRKMRCPPAGVGACVNCRKSGQVCTYSPRSDMGRPRGDGGERQGRVPKSIKKTRTGSNAAKSRKAREEVKETDIDTLAVLQEGASNNKHEPGGWDSALAAQTFDAEMYL